MTDIQEDELISAVTQNLTDEAIELLTKYPSLSDTMYLEADDNYRDKTILQIAVMNRNYDIVKAIVSLKKGLDYMVFSRHRDDEYEGWTALHFACSKLFGPIDFDIVDILFKNGASPNVHERRLVGTPFHLILEEDFKIEDGTMTYWDEERMREIPYESDGEDPFKYMMCLVRNNLVDKLDLDIIGDYMRTVVHWICLTQDIEFLDILHIDPERFIDKGDAFYNETPFTLSCRNPDAGILKRLLPLVKSNQEQLSKGLLGAVKHDLVANAKIVLEYTTPHMDLAVYIRVGEMCELLIDHGLDVNASWNGRTILQHTWNLDVAEVLVNRGANIYVEIDHPEIKEYVDRIVGEVRYDLLALFPDFVVDEITRIA
jgi:ankyrin repeat protein